MKNIWAQSIVITVFVFLSLWGVNALTGLKLFTAFDTIGTALKDFQLTDYAFSKLREDPLVDQRIVLVNFGNLERRDVAGLIRTISEYKPRVIGIDAFYNCEGGLRNPLDCPQLLDTLGNLLLANAIEEAGNVILGEKLLQSDSLLNAGDSNLADSLEVADDIFRVNSHSGFVSLPTDATYQEDAKLCRTVYPWFMVKGKRELAFSTQIAKQYDSAITQRYLDRDKEEEIVNFRGNIEVIRIRDNSAKRDATNSTNYATMFNVLDYDAVQTRNFDPSLFKDKIVMIGFLGSYLGDPSWEDKFFTPMNSKVAGRANPDMFGLVVHANVVAMILNEDYINELPDWLLITIAFIICLLTVVLLITIDNKLPSWFDALSFFVQLVIIIVLSFVMVQAFASQSLKMDLSLTVAVIALVGPVYDVFKSLQNEYNKRFTKRKVDALRDS